ncbi:MAG: hypothetical protein WA877_05390 [Legionella sp.]
MKKHDGERNFKKGDDLLCERNEIKYSFIAEQKKAWPIELMCQVLDVKSDGQQF